MIQVAKAIKSFSSEETIALTVQDLQGIMNELISTYNVLNDILRDYGILRGRELGKFNATAMQKVQLARSPIEKLLLLNVFIKRQISLVRPALNTKPDSGGQLRQAITKIQLRAISIIDHIKTIATGKDKIAFSSSQARDVLAGREGMPPSRRDTIRAMRRAERICPGLNCDHTPNDGRQTMRITARTDEIGAIRQRSDLRDIKIMFNMA